MNPTQVTEKQIQERVQELVASIEQYAKVTRNQARFAHATKKQSELAIAIELADVTVSLATELATLLGKGRLEVSRES